MDSNTYSTRPPAGRPGRLAALAAAVDGLDAEDGNGLSDVVRAEEVLVLRGLVDRLEGQWLKELAGVDARGAAGAEQGVQMASTAAWLRARLRMGKGAAARSVRTARALFRGPLTATAQALTAGEISPAHAAVVAHGTHNLPHQVIADAEPALLEAARQLDPRRLRRVVDHLRLVADPDGAEGDRERRHGRRGLWLTPTWDGMVAVDGLLEAEAGQTVLAALEPLARPASAEDTRSGSQRTADALTELARRTLEAGRLPQTGGVRPQLLVTVDVNGLFGQPGTLGGELGEVGLLDPEGCRRLACDGAVTRVLVTRHPHQGHDHSPHQQPTVQHPHKPSGQDPGPDPHDPPDPPDPEGQPLIRPLNPNQTLTAQLRAAMALLPPVLGGAPTQPLEVGRASRVVQPAQRTALAVRDGGCVFPDCSRPLTWCEAHHLRHWLHGGPTDLANLALLCRAHHRAVHEGGWQLARGPDGRLTATPPQRPYRPDRPHRRQPSVV